MLPRILLREVWRQRTEWDEQVQEECRRAWNDWLSCLVHLEQIRICRWYGELGDEVDIHIFVDASETCNAAAAYAYEQQADRRWTGALIMAKCKVAPLKVKSIPRLEFDAAVLSTRVLNIVCATNCWKIRSVNMWSDMCCTGSVAIEESIHRAWSIESEQLCVRQSWKIGGGYPR